MNITDDSRSTREMGLCVRPMGTRDIRQCEEIERDAFPTQFPYTSFRGELKKRNAVYLVCWTSHTEPYSEVGSTGFDAKSSDGWPSGTLQSFIRSFRGIWESNPDETQDFIAGFLGIWYMMDEAHIVSVGVRENQRGKGIGELLLISAIEHAIARQAAAVTLEVRISNRVAKTLYRKYGFSEKGVRKNYYSDNREDALIMTTEPIISPKYESLFRKLQANHANRWGQTDRRLF